MVHVTLTATICWSASQRSWIQLSRLVSCPDSWQLAPAPDCGRCQAKCQSHNSAPIIAIFSLPTPHSTLSVGNDNVKVEYRWNGSAIRPALYMDHLSAGFSLAEVKCVHFTAQDEINVLLLMEQK